MTVVRQATGLLSRYEAVRDATSAYEPLKISGPESEQMITAGRLGSAYAAQKQFRAAIEAFEKMWHRASLLGDTAAMAYADVRKCGVHIDQGLFGAAAQHCEAATKGLSQAKVSDREERRA